MSTPKGERRRAAIVAAAARLVLVEGPASVTHRRVAELADVPLAATTYYFAGLGDLLAAAGQRIVGAWADGAERVAQRARSDDDLAGELITALLPRRAADIRGHYEHLVGAGRSRVLAREYRRGRARIDAAVTELLRVHACAADPTLLIAVLDGAVVTALSEDRPVRAYAHRQLTDALAALTGD